MKKQASPVPTPRAAALSQSASHYAAGAASSWQNIASKSTRLAIAKRHANALGHAPLAPGQATPPEAPNYHLPVPARIMLAPGQRPEPEETIRQVGWREVERAVGVHTKRKYNLFGFGFGPKVSVFETEKVRLPVYQETDRHKRYYAAVPSEDLARIKREGFQPEFGGSAAKALTSVKYYNTTGHFYFFGSESYAHSYGKNNMSGSYNIVEFVLPEYHDFTSDLEIKNSAEKLNKKNILRTAQNISADCIKRII